MKKMKKILCLCLALAMCLSLVNITALAADGHTHDDNCSLCAEGYHEEGDVCDCCGYGDKGKNPDTEELSPQDDPKDCGVGHHHMALEGNCLVCTICGAKCYQVDENGRHKIDSATDPATCYKDGSATISCDTCGTVTETIPALSADYSGQQWEPCGDGQHKMTCKNCNGTPSGHSRTEKCTDGDGDGKCDGCGAELKTDCDHRAGNHEDEEQYKAPTCTEKGQQVYVCNECDGVVDNKEIAPLGHKWGEWKVNKPATETSEGEEERFCDRCNARETRPISALHKHTLEYCAGTPATCTLSGMEESWYCTKCGEHFRDESGTQPATKEDLTIPALGHDFSVYEKNDEKTHTYKCSRCPETKDYDHALLKHTVLKQPTCTEPGLEEFVCKDENCAWTNKNEIPALGHDLKWCEGEEQSCFAAGRRGYWYCERCNKGFLGDNGTGEFTDKDLLAIPGMDADYNGQQWEPYTDTQHKMVCKNCNGVADKHTEYAPHTWGEWYPVEGSETEHVRECADCNAKQVAGHNFGAWETVKEATATEKGEEKHTCTDCGYEETRETNTVKNPGNQGGNTRYTLTILYRYADGTEAAAQYSQQFESNAPYNVVSPEIAGYRPDVTQVIGEMTGDVTFTVTYSRNVDDVDIGEENPPLIDTPVDIPDEQPPLTDLPDEEPPLVEVPDEEPPLVDLPDEQPPLTDLPVEWPPIVAADDPVPETDISEEPVPLANVPQTGDYSLVWCAMAAASAMGLAVLTLKKREDEEA